MTTKEPNDRFTRIISESTPIRLGLVIALVGLLVGSIAWAGNVSSNVAILAESQTSQKEDIKEILEELKALKKEAYLQERNLYALIHEHLSDPKIHHAGIEKVQLQLNAIVFRLDRLEQKE